MAEITKQDVEKTARLAKLEFTGEQEEVFASQFSNIVKFVEQIAELDTSDVPPTTHAVEKSNVMRADEVKTSMPMQDIEKIAPQFADGNIVVPRIIER